MKRAPEDTLFERGAREAAVRPATGARRVEATSDVRRGRAIAAATGSGAALTLVATLAAPPAGGLAPSRALAPPHVRAAVGCTGCHGAEPEGTASFRAAARAACKGCHGEHTSTRPAHARLAAEGALGCTTCHAIHAPLQGGTRFDPDGQAHRYVTGVEVPVDGPRHATGRDVLVAAVPLAACRPCHEPDRPTDVAARCAGGSPFSTCLDEHQVPLPEGASDVGRKPRRPGRVAPAPAGSGVCAAQHQPDRAFSHDAARRVVDELPDPRGAAAAAVGTGSAPLWLGAGGAGAGLGWGAVAAVEALRRRRRAAKQAALPSPAAAPSRRRLPTVDTSTCLGCHACVDACPYGVLEVERFVAVVARPEACCGLTLCEQRCPNGSLRMIEGDEEPDRIRLSADLESLEVPGVYLAGDVTGVPLIKNAIALGARAAEAAARSLEGRAAVAGAVDLAIVGAGPAGLSAALRAKELGLSYVALDQATVAHSIRSFPRDKLVFDQPLDLPVVGKLWMQESTKEELLGHWLRVVRREGVEVREHVRLSGLRRVGEAFELQLAPGDAAPEERVPPLRARRVVLAIGRRGTPRRLDAPVPPELEPRVHYHLADARSFAGRKVVVVGLGDVAMEAALALAAQPGTSVTILHRGATYSRGQRRNIEAVERQRRAGRLELCFEAAVQGLRPRGPGGVVSLRAAGGPREVPFDALFVLIGSIPPRDLLARLGVSPPPREGASPPSPS